MGNEDAEPGTEEMMVVEKDNHEPAGMARAATTLATASMNTATRSEPLITTSRVGHASREPLMDVSTRRAYGREPKLGASAAGSQAGRTAS
jgi:hypothetical protein